MYLFVMNVMDILAGSSIVYIVITILHLIKKNLKALIFLQQASEDSENKKGREDTFVPSISSR